MILLVAAAYGQAVVFDFVLDDRVSTLGNPVRGWHAGLWSVFSAPTSAFLGQMPGAEKMYRPLLALTMAMDRALWGIHPGGFHLTNVLAHLGAVLAVWRLALWLSGDAVTAFAAGALLALHPSAVEAVAFVSARMDLFVGLGMAATLLLLRRCLAPGGFWRLGGALLCFAFALGSKETAAAIPLQVTWAAAVCPEWFGDSRSPRRWTALANQVAPFWVMLGVYGILRRAIVGNIAPAQIGLRDLPAQLPRMLVAVEAYGQMTLVPRPVTGAALVTRVALPTGAGDWRVLVGFTLLGLLIASLVWTRRRHPSLALALGWYAAGLIPASNVLPIYWQHAVYVAERSLYPSLAGWCLFAALAFRALWAQRGPRLARSSGLAMAMGLASAAVLLIVTVSRTSAWRDDVTLWAAAAASDPTSVVTRYNLARSFAGAGDLNSAHTVVREAASLFPADPYVATLAASIAELRNEPSEALRYYERAFAVGRPEAELLRRAILLAARSQDWERAGRWSALGVRLHPGSAWSHMALGWDRHRQGQDEAAQVHFDRAERLEPNSADRISFLGELFAAEGRRADAVRAYEAAIALDPTFMPAHRALAFEAEQQGNRDAARRHWRHVAVSLSGPERDEALAHLRRLEAASPGAPDGER